MDTVAVATQGDCAAKPGPAILNVTGTDLLALLPRQCLLLTDTHFLTVTNSDLWMDNLYIRLVRSNRTSLEPVLLATGKHSPGLYLSGITLQVPPLPSPYCNPQPSTHCHPPLHIRVTWLQAMWHWRMVLPHALRYCTSLPAVYGFA